MQIHTTDKPFNITKKQVYEAYKAVKSNAGSAGVDGQTIEQFDSDLRNNLYKLWNRMSSGSYIPPPVRAVSIPKKTGGQRILGVPTVADRVAQMVVKQLIEPDLDPIFLADSYGYRPRKSALDAIGVTRKRCWKYDWVLEFDIKGLFDNIDHELLLRAVRRHVTCKWALLYIERWLTAPMEHARPKVPMRRRGADCPVVVTKRCNARGAKGAGHPTLGASQLATGGTPILDGRRQPSCGGTSRMTRECQVRICERLGVKFPGPTRPFRTSRDVRSSVANGGKADMPRKAYFGSD